MSSIQFYKIESMVPAAKLIAEELGRPTDERPILWLLSGGSAIDLAVDIADSLSSLVAKNITVTLADERYGKVGHPDSNWQQLTDKGFNFKKFKSHPILHGKDFPETVTDFENFLISALDDHTVVGLLGMGADGHTSGILPHSPAVKAARLVSGYQGPDHQRITTTAKLLSNLEVAFLYAVGENKHAQLQRLQDDVDIAVQPVQILKTARRLIVLTDYKGAKL